MVRLINRVLCMLGLHDVYHVEDRASGVIEEHCRHCPRVVRAYYPRKW